MNRDFPEDMERLLQSERSIEPTGDAARERLEARLVRDLGIGAAVVASTTTAAKLEALVSGWFWKAGMLVIFVAGGASLVTSRASQDPAVEMAALPAPVTSLAVVSATASPIPEVVPTTDATAPLPSAVPTEVAPRSPKPSASKESACDLTHEVELLTSAQRAMSSQTATQALSIIDRHARECPRGQLIQEREALRVLALRAARRDADAERAKAAFGEQFPESLHEDRLGR